MNPIVPIAGGVMLCSISSSIAMMMMGGEEDPGGGAGSSAGPSAGGAGTPSYPDHPLHGDKFLVRAAPFTGDILPAIIPDPSNEKLVAFDQGETKSASSTMVFEPVESKPNTYRLKHKATGKYWAYWNDGLWEWTTTPTVEHDILLEEMSEDNGKMMYRLSKNPSGNSTLYFGYLYNGKARASFNPEEISDGDHLFKVLDA
jgi:hypothetical protein